MLLLLGCHILRCHALTARHAGLWGWDLGVVHVFGRVDGRFGINAVLVARCRLGRIKACLGRTTLMGRYISICVLWTYLDEILAFRLSNEGLELRSGEGVDESSLGDNEEEDLGAGEDGQLVGLCTGTDQHQLSKAPTVSM